MQVEIKNLYNTVCLFFCVSKVSNISVLYTTLVWVSSCDCKSSLVNNQDSYRLNK